MTVIKFNRNSYSYEIESSLASNGTIYFAKDGGIYVGNSAGEAELKANIAYIVTDFVEDVTYEQVFSAKTIYDVVKEDEYVTATALTEISEKVAKLSYQVSQVNENILSIQNDLNSLTNRLTYTETRVTSTENILNEITINA